MAGGTWAALPPACQAVRVHARFCVWPVGGFGAHQLNGCELSPARWGGGGEVSMASMASMASRPRVTALRLPILLALLLPLAARAGGGGGLDVLLSARACEDAGAVSPAAAGSLRGALARLVESSYLSYFHVAIDRACPFWDAAGQCAMRECSVSGCEPRDVPPALRDADAGELALAAASLAPDAGAGGGGGTSARRAPTGLREPCGEDGLHGVDRSFDGGAVGWAASAEPEDWAVQDGVDAGLIYVDLRRNPERFTGYAGAQANGVWEAIYEENCFAVSGNCRTGVCSPDACKEERVFYRAVSGLHTSITMHIAAGYLRGGAWGRNVAVFASRVRAFPERVTNLRVALAIVLRAIAKAAPSLHPAVHNWSAGEAKEDAQIRADVHALLRHPLLAHGCDVFDESDMFVVDNVQARLPEFRNAFRNISMIMDCVGCEKCRLWGKLQFLGLGTALRILFAENDQYELKRNEVVALFNLLYKLLSSVVWVDEMTRELEQRARLYALLGKVGAGALLLFACVRLNASSKSGTSSNVQPKPSRQAEQAAREGAEQPVAEETPRQAPGSAQVEEVRPVRRRRKATAD